MNIAYVLNATVANGGATKAFLNMMDGLMQYGVKPFVVVPDKEGVYHELTKRQIPTLVVTFRYSAYPHSHTLKQRILFLPRLAARIYVNWKAAKVLATYIKDNKIDIVHSNVGVVRIGFNAAQRVGIPHIYHIREYADKCGYHYFPTNNSFAHQLQGNQSFSICITRDIQKYYQQGEVIVSDSGNKIKASRVIYDGVLSQMNALPKSEGKKEYFLYAGRIQPAKGLDQLLLAYSIYARKAEKPLHLKVAGSNGDDAYYQKQLDFIRDNQLTDLVELLGNRDDITALMRKARALVVSSPFEGFGFCMPEAQQQGCLVIGRNTSGTKEQLDNALTMNGKEIALRYETAEELAELLSQVADNPPQYYQAMTEQAFAIVNSLYTKERHAKEVFQFYQDILNKNNC